MADHAKLIWDQSPRVARQRSSLADTRRALEAALRRGHDPDRIAAGLEAAYASETYAGDRAKGVHRLIENDRWEPWAPDTIAGMGGRSAETWARFLRSWSEAGWWSDELGPRPGEPGCQVPADLLERIGIEPEPRPPPPHDRDPPALRPETRGALL